MGVVTIPYTPKKAFLSKDPEKRQSQLANLKQNWGKSKPREIEGVLPKWDIKAYKGDIIGFSGQFVVPETRKPIVLEDWQVDNFFKPIFYSEEKPSLALLSLCKKNGKSCLAALCVLYVFFCGEPLNEIYICAHDKDQASDIVFRKVLMAIKFNPRMMVQCKIREDYIEHVATGSRIKVLPNDWRSSAGLNPGMIVIDELFAFDLEAAERFYNELQLGPTRKDPLTLITSTAGYSQGGLLWELWQKGLENIRSKSGYNPDYYSFISHNNLASWVTDKWLSKQRKKMRASLYKRLHCNEWTSGEEAFISEDTWDACVDQKLKPSLPSKDIHITTGIDIGIKSDYSSCVSVSRDNNKVRLVTYKIWKPTKKNPIDLEVVETYIKELAKGYILDTVLFDPYQFHRSGMSLKKQGIHTEEYPQTSDRLVKMGQLLYDLITQGNMELYPDEELRREALHTKAKETQRGWRLTKAGSGKIDAIIALAMACAGCIEKVQSRPGKVYVDNGEPLMDHEIDALSARREPGKGHVYIA